MRTGVGYSILLGIQMTFDPIQLISDTNIPNGRSLDEVVAMTRTTNDGFVDSKFMFPPKNIILNDHVTDKIPIGCGAELRVAHYTFFEKAQPAGNALRKIWTKTTKVFVFLLEIF